MGNVNVVSNEGPIILSNGSVLMAMAEYNSFKRSNELMGEVVSMISKGRSPEDVVAYIKLQTAAWVVDRL